MWQFAKDVDAGRVLKKDTCTLVEEGSEMS